MAETFRYIDGNNNAYVIDGESLAYVPVTPAQSSSGTYSGGTPKTITLTREQHEAIEALADRIVVDPANHLATRPKGCGTIQRSATRVCFESPLKAELERVLKAALSDA